MRYVKALLEIPALAELLESETAESVDLTNRVTIEVGTASHRATRGYTLAAALCDEISFWPQEDSAAPDVEILASLRPAMTTIPGAMLLCASSPYAKKGALWAAFRRFFGVDDPNVLVWRAPTRTMNPTISERVIAEARERDPDAARSEYDAEFRDDIANFVGREALDGAIEIGVIVRAPLGDISYVAFTDPSGGSSDSMTLAIAHAESERIVLDFVREKRKAPFSPASVVEEFAGVLKQYRLSTVTGDRYAGESAAGGFQGFGVAYQVSPLNRSELYLSTLPLLNSGRVRLLDNQRMAAQFIALERRTSRAGRDWSIVRPAPTTTLPTPSRARSCPRSANKRIHGLPSCEARPLEPNWRTNEAAVIALASPSGRVDTSASTEGAPSADHPQAAASAPAHDPLNELLAERAALESALARLDVSPRGGSPRRGSMRSSRR